MGGYMRLWVLSSALAETLLFSGCLLGWNSLSPILMELGVLSQDCYSDPGLSEVWSNDTADGSHINHSADVSSSLAEMKVGHRDPPDFCTSQRRSLNLGFTVGSVFLWGAFLPLQLLMGYAQIRSLRQIGGALISVSCLMLSYCCSNHHNLSLFLPFALVAQGVGGSCVLFSSLMLPHILPDVGSLYPALVIGGFSASATVFTIIKVIYRAGVPFVPIMLGYGAISCAMFLNSFFCWGLDQPGKKEENMYRVQLQLNCYETLHKTSQETEWCQKSLKHKFQRSLRDRERLWSQRRTMSFKRPTAIPAAPPLQDSLRTPTFILHLLSDSILLTWIYFYISSVSLQLHSMTDTPLQEDLFSSVFGALQMLGLFTAPLICVLMHNHRLRQRPRKNTGARSKCTMNRLSAIYTLRILVVCCFGICCLIPSLAVQIIAFVLHVVVRTSMFLISSTLYHCVFPNTHFGVLLGIHTLITSVLTLIQHPVFLLLTGSLRGNPFWIHCVFLILSLVAAAVPLYLIIRDRKRRHCGLSRPIPLQRVTLSAMTGSRSQSC
ncbi:large neutral amino acids transporter small subunit 4-like [Mixophyes fleayi]|uniref:large neutral amino acids transporter small subunit 4-like n=1 Tax=Mixophyes fleayi TaxID=3061075 RepID=UPI003F4D7F4F